MTNGAYCGGAAADEEGRKRKKSRMTFAESDLGSA